MKCDRCEREATIEEVTKVGQTYVYKHLCEACAAEEGLEASNVNSKKPAVVAVKARTSRPTVTECARCGLSFAAFRENARLGCPTCYESFESRLSPMIERAQEGGTHHVGKTPKRMFAAVEGEGPDRVRAIEQALGESKERLEKIEQLNRQLRAALTGERFEQAALIRDEIRRLRDSVPEDVGVTHKPGEGDPGHGDH